MTYISTVEQLYKLIPETKELYETSFNDLSELLNSLVSKIEYSGKWEFVQYIQNKPSLFITRKKSKYNKNAPTEPLQTPSYIDSDKNVEEFKSVISVDHYMEEEDKEIDIAGPIILSDDYLSVDKMPWDV